MPAPHGAQFEAISIALAMTRYLAEGLVTLKELVQRPQFLQRLGRERPAYMLANKSSEPFAQRARLFGDKVLVGAGTVLEAYEVDEVADAGAKLVVAPNADRAVIELAVKLGLVAVPGVATPTEAFAALKAGASGLKLFPAESIPPEAVKAWRSVLPKETSRFTSPFGSP